MAPPDTGRPLVAPREGQRAAATADSPRANPATAPKPARNARRRYPARKARPLQPDSETLAAAKGEAVEMARQLRVDLGHRLTREEWEQLARAFRSNVVPKRKPGRRRKAQVTAALADWKAGVRGIELYRKHIPGWERHHRYRRIGEQKGLMDAIRSRRRREQAKPFDQNVVRDYAEAT